MSLTYVIPDIHGRYDLLSDALTDISARSGGEAGVIVTIGDTSTRGRTAKRLLTGCSQALPTACASLH